MERDSKDHEPHAEMSASDRIQLMHDLLLGRTPIGDRVWDMSRLIDWAIATQEIDSERIAMTGNSGGGTITVFAAACDPRISVAVPSSHFCTFQGSIGSIHHCDSELCQSSGGRAIRMVSYGEFEEHLRGTANLRSALGAHNPELYFKRKERKRPVLAIMAGVHGHEIEGMVGALSLIHIMETGEDLRGRRQSELRSLLERLNLLIIPLINPDGRAHVPYAGLCGLSWETMRFIGQGTHAG